MVEMIYGINLDDNTHSQDPDDVICMCTTGGLYKMHHIVCQHSGRNELEK